MSLIMMAAGDSTRFCQNHIKIKKQWLRVDDEPLWLVATRKIASYAHFQKIFITASSTDYRYMRHICPANICGVDIEVVHGGDTRTQSLRNALRLVSTTFVLVSDVARWDSVESVISHLCTKSFKAMCKDENVGCVVPFLPVADTSFYANDKDVNVSTCEGRYLKRECLKLIQTPQLSRVSLLKQALESSKEFSDESSAIYALGKKVLFIEGSPLMNKITFDGDLSFHVARLKPVSDRVFIGYGIDVHSFEDSKPMWLGGIKIESPFGFKAHSDGDVLLHALCDAILGAIGAGDIGQWFPDTDIAYKDADSKALLKQVYTFAQSVGYEICNIDVSIMAQTPKITPYKESICRCVADILQMPHRYVNIKATTTEELGFIGRKEGVCVQVSVSMRFANWHNFIPKEQE